MLYILHADLTRVDEPTVCDTMAGSVSFRWLILKFVSWQDCEGHALTRRLFHHLIWQWKHTLIFLFMCNIAF